MAPKRHHILPRFLLEGFASRKKGKETFAFVFRPGRGPYETNIKNIAVEQHFYGKDTALERMLASQESDAAATIQALRAGRPGPISSPQSVSRFIAALIARTRHVRDSFNEIATEGVDKLLTRMNEVGFPELARRYIERHPELVPDMLRRVLRLPAGAPLPSHLEPLVTRLLLDLVGRQAPGVPMTAEVRQAFRGYDVGKAQNDALAKIEEEAAPDRFASFAWETVRCPDSVYVLGDLGPVATGEDGRIESPFALGPKLVTVILPVSSEFLLVGARSSRTGLPTAAELNRATAELSREFFVAGTVDVGTAIQSIVAARGRVLSSEDLDRIVDDAIDNL